MTLNTHRHRNLLWRSCVWITVIVLIPPMPASQIIINGSVMAEDPCWDRKLNPGGITGSCADCVETSFLDGYCPPGGVITVFPHYKCVPATTLGKRECTRQWQNIGAYNACEPQIDLGNLALCFLAIGACGPICVACIPACVTVILCVGCLAGCAASCGSIYPACRFCNWVKCGPSTTSEYIYDWVSTGLKGQACCPE